MMLYIAACGVLVIYSYCYIRKYGRKPILYCKSKTRLAEMMSSLTSLQKRYMPLFWVAEPMCLALVRHVLPCLANVQYRREVVEGNDGGQFYLQWCDNNDSHRFPDSSTRPTVIIVPGLMSTTRSSYIQSITVRLVRAGHRVVVLIYRGLEDMEVLTPQTFSATFFGDLDKAVTTIYQYYPKSQILAVGASMGSLILAHYLVKTGRDCKVHACMFFCCPFNPPLCAKEIEKNHFLLDRPMVSEHKRIYRRNSQVFDSIVDHEKIMNTACTREFDRYFTAPVFGYNSPEEYYEDCILGGEKLEKIEIPVLCVSSNDDPLCPEKGIPKMDICRTENIGLVLTHGGSHISHIQGYNPFGMTYFEEIMLEYFEKFLKAHS